MTDPKQNNRDDLQGKGTQGPQGTESEQTSGEQLTGGEVSDNALSEGGNAPDDSLYAKVYKKRAASGSSDKGGASATPAVEGGEEEVPPLPPRNFDVHSEAELAEALSSQPRDLGTHTEVGQMGTDPSPQADSTYFMEIDPYGSEHSDEEVHGYEVFSEEEENIYEDPDFVGQSQAGSYSSHGMYALASGYSAMDFDSEKWLNVRESVIGGYSVSSDDLVTKGPVYDIRTKILTSDGKLSKFEVEKIVNTLYSNAELVREELCEPLSGNVNDFGNVNCEDVTTLLHIAYRHNVSSKIIGAMRDICGTIPYGVVDAQCKLPIHYAAQNCSPKTVLECYNSTGGGVVDTLDFNGRSFSHYLSANKKCSQELVRQVLDEGSLCCYDKSGKLPVHCFAETATSEVLFSVVESMLSSAQTAALVLSPDGEGRNILHHVVGNPHCTKKDLKQLVKLTSGDVNTQDYYGRTPIMYAAYNKGKLISRLVKCGADINEKDVDGRMVLHHAAISGSRTAIMNVLKQSGLDCAAHDKLGYTALHHASAKSAKVMKALLSLDGVKDEGVKNGMRLALFSEDANGNMPINSACIEGNHKAAENVCLAVMKYYGPEVLESMLIQENKCENTLDLSEFCLMDVLDAGRELYVSAARSELPLSPLHNAIRNCDLKLLKALIDAVPNPGKLLQKQCSAGLTPLQLSVLFGDKDVVKCVARNVPTSQFNDPGGIGITPLNLACLQNRVGLVEALLTNVDIDINQQMGESRNTVLHTAVHRSNAGLVKKLLSKKNIDVNVQNSSGNTPLHVAAATGNVSAFKKLVQHTADVNILNTSGVSPVSMAIGPYNKEDDIIKILISSKTKLKTNADSDKNYAIQKSVECGYNKLLGELLSCGFRVHDGAGKSPLVSAVKNGNVGATKQLIEVGGGNVNSKVDMPGDQHNGYSLLMMAVENLDSGMTKMLLAHKCDVAMCGPNGDTACHMLVKSKKVNFARYVINEMVKSGINLGEAFSQKDSGGYTPLHLAVESSNFAVASAAVKAMSKRSLLGVAGLTSPGGKTLLHLCVETGKLDLVKLVLDRIGAAEFGRLVTKQDGDGNTILHKALESGDDKMVKLVMGYVSKGAARTLSNTRNKLGNTPLHLALSSESFYAEKFMYLCNMDVFLSTNSEGKSPLGCIAPGSKFLNRRLFGFKKSVFFEIGELEQKARAVSAIGTTAAPTSGSLPHGEQVDSQESGGGIGVSCGTKLRASGVTGVMSRVARGGYDALSETSSSLSDTDSSFSFVESACSQVGGAVGGAPNTNDSEVDTKRSSGSSFDIIGSSDERAYETCASGGFDNVGFSAEEIEDIAKGMSGVSVGDSAALPGNMVQAVVTNQKSSCQSK